MDYGSATSAYGYSYGWGNMPTQPAPPPPPPTQSKEQQQYAAAAYAAMGGDPHKLNSLTTAAATANQNRTLGGYWAAPTPTSGKAPGQPTPVNHYAMSGFPGPSPFAKSSFPKKTNWAEKKRMMAKKPYNATGKTPAMLLHELFKNVLERFDDLSPNKQAATKMYRCVVTVDGRDFSAEAPNKKLAKQKAAEVAVNSLRPDIQISPWEETKPQVIKQEPPKKKAKIATEVSNVAANTTQKEINRATALETALSLQDLLRKLCGERNGYELQMEHTNITEGDHAKVPPNKHRFKFELNFPAQNKQYIKEGYGKSGPKDLAIREALKELFGVSDFDIQRIVKRSLSAKITQMNPVQVLHHMASIMNKELTFVVHEESKKDVKKLQTAPTGYYATCTVKDLQNPENQSTVTGDVAQSKVEAKLLVAKLANVEIFGIDLDNIPEKPAIPVPACQKLQILLTKKNRGRVPKIAYEDLVPQPDSTGTSPVFRIKCKINDKEEFFGVGKNKKAAKNDAAHQALKGIFKFDYDENLNNDPSPHFGISKLCYDISEYTKREYFQMCGFYGVRQSTEMAAFFLLNEKDEKRLISIASCPLTLIDPRQLVDADGLALIHMQSIVMARRSMLRYFLSEYEKLGTEKDGDSIFQKVPDGQPTLRTGLRVVLYSTFAPDVRFSAPDAPQPSLTIYTQQNSIERTPDDQQTMEDALNTGFLRVHTVADKIFKWCHLGVQGGLLSTLVQPIKLASVYFGSTPNVEDTALRHSFYNRIGATVSTDTVVESNKVAIAPTATVPHVWTRDVEHLETLNPMTGRSARGSPSRLCKAELFQMYIRTNKDAASLTYNEAKALAKNYQSMKLMFYQKIAELGYGNWQRKPEKVGDFKSPASS